MSAASRATMMLITTENEAQARAIGYALVGERLAACVNILSPIRSIYRWNEEVQADNEHLLLIKTRANLVAKIESRVRELHSYELPEVIAISIAGGSKRYLDWLLDSTRPAPARRTNPVPRKK